MSSVAASIIAASGAVHSVGDEIAFADAIVNTIQNLNSSSVYSSWPQGIAARASL